MALHSAWPAGTPRIHWTFAPKTPEISRSEHEGDEVGLAPVRATQFIHGKDLPAFRPHRELRVRTESPHPGYPARHRVPGDRRDDGPVRPLPSADAGPLKQILDLPRRILPDRRIPVAGVPVPQAQRPWYQIPVKQHSLAFIVQRGRFGNTEEPGPYGPPGTGWQRNRSGDRQRQVVPGAGPAPSAGESNRSDRAPSVRSFRIESIRRRSSAVRPCQNLSSSTAQSAVLARADSILGFQRCRRAGSKSWRRRFRVNPGSRLLRSSRHPREPRIEVAAVVAPGNAAFPQVVEDLVPGNVQHRAHNPFPKRRPDAAKAPSARAPEKPE